MGRALAALCLLAGCASPATEDAPTVMELHPLKRDPSGLMGTIRDVETWNDQLAILTDRGVFAHPIEGGELRTVHIFDAPLGAHGGLLRESFGHLLVVGDDAVMRFENPESVPATLSLPPANLSFVRPEGLAVKSDRFALFDAEAGALWTLGPEGEEPISRSISADRVALAWAGTELFVAFVNDSGVAKVQAEGPLGSVRELRVSDSFSDVCSFVKLGDQLHLIADGSQFRVDGDQLIRVGSAGQCSSHLGTSDGAAYFTERGHQIDVYSQRGWDRYPIAQETETYFGTVHQSQLHLATYFDLYRPIELNSVVTTEASGARTHASLTGPNRSRVRADPSPSGVQWFEDPSLQVGHQHGRLMTFAKEHTDFSHVGRVAHQSRGATWFIEEHVAYGHFPNEVRRVDLDFDFQRVFPVDSGLAFVLENGGFTLLHETGPNLWTQITPERPLGAVRQVVGTSQRLVVLTATELLVLEADGSTMELSNRIMVLPAAIVDIAMVDESLAVVTEDEIFSLYVPSPAPASSLALPSPYQRGTLTVRETELLLVTESGALTFNSGDMLSTRREFLFSGPVAVQDFLCVDACYFLSDGDVFRAEL